MAPRGQRTYSLQYFLIPTIGLLAITFITLVVFRDQLLSAIRSLSLIHPTFQCPTTPPLTSMNQNHQEHNEKPAFISTIYADITILDELPLANVLWVNKSFNSQPEAWGISMFHALHCVKMWRDSLSPATMMNSHVHSESEYTEHAEHCISYLTQSIVCAADGTIEPAEDIVVENKHGRRIHGMGYTHQCRDTSLLFEMNGKEVGLWNWKQGDTLHSVFE
ncbi:hypothetical protein N7520_002033 [Penicillium odoratum]|uniref:uncharacterized protein n=1 Tax=Penicillium odoratum TaxID=1167516 RepID=UPI002548A7B0|nr:uncharacterized protein N7520_002033 [Penicillium odoratum]KAJ5778787.1 hypothetical protein N7520_002033 [Penicillium odoratum]